MINLTSMAQVNLLHKNDTFVYKNCKYTALSDPYEKNGVMGVDIAADNTFWNTARKYDLETKLRALGRNIAIQSEQTGPGISGNVYGFTDYFLFVFDIFDIDNQRYFSPDETQALIKELDLISVPIIKSADVLDASLDELLLMADGKSDLGTTGTLREGLVFKANQSERVSWKAVSNAYLLNSKD